MRLRVAAALLFMLGTSAPAYADPAARARFHDELAREHYRHGRYEAALREFFFENSVAPNPRIVFNIALCFDQLRRYDEAFLFFSEYLAADDEDAERRARASQAMERLAPRVARVAVRSDPPGVEVYVDRRELGSYGRTPRVLVLPPGPHALRFEREGYAPLELRVEAVRGQEVAVHATLERIVGRLVVVAVGGARVAVRDAAGASVHEGEIDAQTGRVELDLPPASYELEVHAAGYRPWRGLARVEAGTASEQEVDLEPLPEPSGDLTITSSSAGAVIELDGQPVGFAPAVLDGLTAGRRRVRLTHAGLQPWEGFVEVHPNERAWLTVSLAPPPETRRSDATWVVGGVGVTALAAGGVLALLAAAHHASFRALPGDLDRRDQALEGRALNLGADILLGAGAVALALAVVLYFVTESTESERSRGSISRGER